MPDGYTKHEARGDGNCLYHAVLEASYAKQINPGYHEDFKDDMKRVIKKDESAVWMKSHGETPSYLDNSEEGKSHPMIQQKLREKIAEYITSGKMKDECSDLNAIYDKDGSDLQKQSYNTLLINTLRMGEYGGFTQMALIRCMYKIKIKLFDGRITMASDKDGKRGNKLPDKHPRWMFSSDTDDNQREIILYWTGGHFDWLTKD